MRRWTLLLALPALSCAAPDPKVELEVLGLETYWAVESSRGQERYIAPVVRFEVRNKGAVPQLSVEVSAGFRRANDEGVFVEWGGDFLRVSSSRQPLQPGERRLVVLKSDARYHSPGTPESMFAHAEFRDPRVEVYMRAGSSNWVKFREAAVERRVGSRSVPDDVRDAAPR